MYQKQSLLEAWFHMGLPSWWDVTWDVSENENNELRSLDPAKPTSTFQLLELTYLVPCTQPSWLLLCFKKKKNAVSEFFQNIFCH